MQGKVQPGGTIAKAPARKIRQRMIIYSKDVEIITGRKHRTCCTLLQSIRKSIGKNKHQFVTIKEFCIYTGLDEELVREFIID